MTHKNELNGVTEMTLLVMDDLDKYCSVLDFAIIRALSS